MRKLILAVIAALACESSGMASFADDGYVTGYDILSSGVVIFSHSGSRTAQPACSTLNRFAITGTTPAGQVMTSHLLTAFAAHKLVNITGSGACADWSDSEGVNYIHIKQ